MRRKVIATADAPVAIGPYSQAIRAGRLLFCSGQIPLTVAGEMVTTGIEAQTRQVMKNLGAVVAEAGGSLEQIVKTTIYLADLGDFSAVNQVYAEFFPAEPPARATVQVAALPKGAGVEIEAIALLE